MRVAVPPSVIQIVVRDWLAPLFEFVLINVRLCGTESLFRSRAVGGDERYRCPSYDPSVCALFKMPAEVK